MTPDELALYRGLDAAALRPLWTITEELLTPSPRPATVPWLWPAATTMPLARAAIRLVPVERGGERRVLALANPGLGGLPYAAGTLWAGLQCLGPRETAPAHRHTPGAVRFVLQGAGVFTTVDGDACDMGPGDLVLTPSGSWHDHTNAGDGEMYWFDGLDLPLVAAVDGVFFEHWPGPGEHQSRPVAHNAAEALALPGPRWTRGAVADVVNRRPSPLLTYRWSDTDAELRRLARESGDALLALEYTDPTSGSSVLPTMACAVHRLRGHSAPVRRAGNTVYVVFRGRGTSVVDGGRFAWGPGDIFVVPSWCAVDHDAADADLFVLSDEPALRALGLDRREVLPHPQRITSEFVPEGAST